MDDLPVANSGVLAQYLVAREPSASAAAMHAESKDRLIGALDSLPTIDREVLALRYVEQLNNAEAALALGIQEIAARKRHVRALRRLKAALAEPCSESEGGNASQQAADTSGSESATQ